MAQSVARQGWAGVIIRVSARLITVKAELITVKAGLIIRVKTELIRFCLGLWIKMVHTVICIQSIYWVRLGLG